ncbi:concanavalin A-like lectin/glucanase domain-containing protein [Thermothelomyces heterothallicus CBS 202.75]|uniref:concanavalin A-like lectin/glucanase domain-containing protein n=1 Tax=Thermothelomyces heterothallicus CBS 202.75 TaxID=1149848 RepID=UPI003743C85D
MKPTVVLTLLASGAYAAATPAIPGYSPRTRGMNPQHHAPLRLLHTFTPISTSGKNFRFLASSTESTKGGAILGLPDNDLSTVRTTIRIPAAKMPTAGPTANNTVGEYAASFWVGIDSATDACGAGGSLRAGVDIFWDGTLGGQQTPFAWYQGPGQADVVGFGGGFPVGEGDLVRLTLEAGPAGGEEIAVVAENFGRNVTRADEGAVPVRKVRKVLPAEAGGQKLCRGEAAWMVEDFPLQGRPEFPTALANFTSVTFNSGITLDDGTEKDLTGAEVLDIQLEAQGGRLTSCEVVDDRNVKCARAVGDN